MNTTACRLAVAHLRSVNMVGHRGYLEDATLEPYGGRFSYMAARSTAWRETDGRPDHRAVPES